MQGGSTENECRKDLWKELEVRAPPAVQNLAGLSLYGTGGLQAGAGRYDSEPMP